MNGSVRASFLTYYYVSLGIIAWWVSVGSSNNNITMFQIIKQRHEREHDEINEKHLYRHEHQESKRLLLGSSSTFLRSPPIIINNGIYIYINVSIQQHVLNCSSVCVFIILTSNSLITIGNATIENPIFQTSYYIFFGDIGSVLPSINLNYYIYPCVGSISGRVSPVLGNSKNGLRVSAIYSTVRLFQLLLDVS